MRISDWSSDVCSSDLQPRAFPDGGTGRYPARAQMREYLAKHMRASGRHQPDRGLVLASRVRADDVDRLRPIELVDLKTTIDHRPIPAEQVDEAALSVGEHGLEERLAPRLAMACDDVVYERCSQSANHREGKIGRT